MLLIHRQLFGVDEFVFHLFKEVVIKSNAPSAPDTRPVPPLEQVDDLGENVIEGHGGPSARLASSLWYGLR